MELKRIEHKLTVCKVSDTSSINMAADFYFIGKTDEELSLVCKTEDTPQNTVARDDGWRGYYILVKEENYERALNILASEGYTVV